MTIEEKQADSDKAQKSNPKRARMRVNSATSPLKEMAAPREASLKDRLEKEIIKCNQLTEKLNQLTESSKVIIVDPSEIDFDADTFYNREEEDFSGEDFQELISSLSERQHNDSPVGIASLAPGSDKKWKLLFGRRRAAAAREGGFKIKAELYENLSLKNEFELQFRENNKRLELSKYSMYRQFKDALDKNVYRNQQQIADENNMSKATISKIMSLEYMPEDIVDLFRSKRNISPSLLGGFLAGMKSDKRQEKLSIIRERRSLLVHDSLDDRDVIDLLNDLYLLKLAYKLYGESGLAFESVEEAKSLIRGEENKGNQGVNATPSKAASSSYSGKKMALIEGRSGTIARLFVTSKGKSNLKFDDDKALFAEYLASEVISDLYESASFKEWVEKRKEEKND